MDTLKPLIATKAPGLDKMISSSPATVNANMEGFMNKLGGNIKNWQKRYFKLAGSMLEYYASTETKDGKVMIS
jgi:hypothetical protein